MKRLVLALLFVLAGALVVSAGSTEIGATVKTVCSACHPLKPVCRQMGVKDRAAWDKTVKRMVTNGAKLTDAQVEPTVDYLATVKPDQAAVCR
ncbi:hypothetical protein [Pseudodesulfovibrio sp.]|uniref:hypothetical protein n=1 Tax=unclassified Pseudodesulfovibrio TaxID=2661612 RepID=UPI003B006FF3